MSDSAHARSAPKNGLRDFALVLGAIFALNAFIIVSSIPPSAAKAVSMFVAAVLLALPVIAIFRAGDYPWSPRLAVGMLLAGVALQATTVIVSNLAGLDPMAAFLIRAVGNIGLIVWCVALGGLLATLLKDKNLILPISIFLAAFDIFLVLTPMGLTNQILRHAPQALPNVGYVIPRATTRPQVEGPGAFAFVGPADFIFMAMFFIAMYRYKMRVRETMFALIPTLIFYLAFVFLVGPLPALVPIGLCVIFVNLREFKLSRDEWVSTGVLALIMAAVIGWAATRPKPPAEPSKQATGQEGSGSEGLRPQGPPGKPPF